LLSVQYFACANMAGFIMNFKIQYTTDNQDWITLEWKSPSFPIDQTKVSPDLASIGVPANAVGVRPQVHAYLGKTHSGKPAVLYDANGQTATYEVKGTTQIYSVKLIGGGS
jgi:hypothetical protein